MNSKLILTLITFFFLSIINGQDCEIIELAVANVSCNGNSDGKIVLDNTIYCASPVTYSWAHGESGNSIYNLSAGLYEVTLTASDGFQIEKNWLITEPDAIDIQASLYDVSCTGQNDGSIYISVLGGTYPFDFEWSNGSTDAFIFDAASGNYTVTVTDDHFCTEEATFTIEEPEPLSIIVDLFDNISCQDENDGHIIVSAEGGTTDSGTSMVDYYFEWSTGEYDVNELDNLSQGTYTVTVSDYNLCTESMSFVVTNPSDIYVTFPQITNLTCNGNNSGIIEINAGGGTGDLSYNWSNGATGNIITNLAAGVFSMTITDENGCTFNEAYFTTEPPAITEFTADIVDLSCYQDESGEIEVFFSGGTGNLSYSWSNGSTSSDQQGLDAGTYSLTVTDENDCTSINSYNISEPIEIFVTSPSITDVDCFGNGNGSIEINPGGGTPNYSYSWSNGSTSNILTGLSGGTYTLTISDANGCTYTESYNIFEPNEIIVTNPTITDVDCFGNENGSIEIFPTGGNPNYSYAWSNGSTSNILTAISGGTYTLTISDENGCTYIDSYTVFEPSPITVTNPLITNIDCFGNGNGSIEISPTGGNPSYDYTWSNGSSSNILTNIDGGSYTLTITDTNGCIYIDTYTVDEPDLITVPNPIVTDVDCSGNENGSIEINPSGGSPNYTYAWSNGNTSNINSNLNGGAYTLTITDENDCSFVETYSVFEPSEISVTNPSIIDVDCFDNENGSIEISPNGGSPNYSFSWSNGSTSSINSGLSGGAYTLTITDDNGCIFIDTYSVSEPSQISVPNPNITDVDCFNGANGSIEINPNGGTPNYSYLWSNGSTSNIITGLSGGSYTLTIVDENGCTFIDSYSVSEPTEIVAVETIVDVECGSGNTGSISLDISGGAGGYLIEWSTGETTNAISNLASGGYTVTITDEDDCVYYNTYFVAQPGDIDVVSSNVEDNLCPNENSGSITIEVNGGAGSLIYSWSNGSANQNITNLSTGIYTLTITDENDCNLVEEFEIQGPVEMQTENLTITPVPCFGEENGQISFLPVGGNSPFLIEWTYTSINGSQPIITESTNVTGNISHSFGAGNVEIKISDVNLCVLELEDIIIDQTPEIEYSAPQITDVACNGESSGMISFNITGGTSPFSVEWTYIPQNGGETFVEWTYNVTDTASYSFVAGTVMPTIVDANGCEFDVETIIITEPQPLTFSNIQVNTPKCAGESSGLASFFISGGSSPYAVEWTYIPNEGGETYVEWTYNVADTASYQFPASIVMPKVTDANGCIVEVDIITISEPAQLEIGSFIINDALCYGDTSGQIMFEILGGTSPFAIEFEYTPIGSIDPIYTTVNSQSGSVNELFASGKVNAQIEDANGCLFDMPTQQIGVKNEILIEQLDIVQPKCGADSSGLVSILLSGGASPYAIEWTYIPAGGSQIYVEWTYNITGTEQFNFSPGTLYALIEDANGCTFILDEILLENVDGIQYEEIKVTYNEGLGNIDLVFDVATDDLTFEWVGPDGFTSKDQNIMNLKSGIYSCVITDGNGCKTLTGSIEILITSVEEINTSENITINTLSTGLLSIKVKSDTYSRMVCYDINGQQLLIQHLEFGDNMIDISNLPTGIYVVVVQSDKDILSQLISKF